MTSPLAVANTPLLDGRYATSGRMLRDRYRSEALKCREHAHRYRRMGSDVCFHIFMKNALRNWRLFRAYQADVEAFYAS